MVGQVAQEGRGIWQLIQQALQVGQHALRAGAVGERVQQVGEEEVDGAAAFLAGGDVQQGAVGRPPVGKTGGRERSLDRDFIQVLSRHFRIKMEVVIHCDVLQTGGVCIVS